PYQARRPASAADCPATTAWAAAVGMAAGASPSRAMAAARASIERVAFMVCSGNWAMAAGSADPLPQRRFLLEPVELEALEVAARDDAPDPPLFVDTGQVAVAAVAHHTQGVDRRGLGVDRVRSGRHRRRQPDLGGMAALGEHLHR